MERLFGKPNAPSQRASVEAADEAMPARLVQVLEKASATDTEAAGSKPRASTLETSLWLRLCSWFKATDGSKPQASALQARQEALQKLEAKQQAHKEAVQKHEAMLAAKLQAKREAAAELEAMFSPDEQAVLREMPEEEAELCQLEGEMGGTYPIDWRGVQVSEVALELLLKSGWLERDEVPRNLDDFFADRPAAEEAEKEAEREAAKQQKKEERKKEQAVLKKELERKKELVLQRLGFATLEEWLARGKGVEGHMRWRP